MSIACYFFGVSESSTDVVSIGFVCIVFEDLGGVSCLRTAAGLLVGAAGAVSDCNISSCVGCGGVVTAGVIKDAVPNGNQPLRQLSQSSPTARATTSIRIHCPILS